MNLPFSSSTLPWNSYIEKRDDAQRSYVRRIRWCPWFLLKETLEIAHIHLRRLPMHTPDFAPPPDPETPGLSVTQYRKFRGLE